eukprot:4723091-Pyramimonas_sp.AAC.1
MYSWSCSKRFTKTNTCCRRPSLASSDAAPGDPARCAVAPAAAGCMKVFGASSSALGAAFHSNQPAYTTK